MKIMQLSHFPQVRDAPARGAAPPRWPPPPPPAAGPHTRRGAGRSPSGGAAPALRGRAGHGAASSQPQFLPTPGWE